MSTRGSPKGAGRARGGTAPKEHLVTAAELDQKLRAHAVKSAQEYAAKLYPDSPHARAARAEVARYRTGDLSVPHPSKAPEKESLHGAEARHDRDALRAEVWLHNGPGVLASEEERTAAREMARDAYARSKQARTEINRQTTAKWQAKQQRENAKAQARYAREAKARAKEVTPDAIRKEYADAAAKGSWQRLQTIDIMPALRPFANLGEAARKASEAMNTEASRRASARLINAVAHVEQGHLEREATKPGSAARAKAEAELAKWNAEVRSRQVAFHRTWASEYERLNGGKAPARIAQTPSERQAAERASKAASARKSADASLVKQLESDAKRTPTYLAAATKHYSTIASARSAMQRAQGDMARHSEYNPRAVAGRDNTIIRAGQQTNYTRAKAAYEAARATVSRLEAARDADLKRVAASELPRVAQAHNARLIAAGLTPDEAATRLSTKITSGARRSKKSN